jgi:hypothetical protein
MVLSCSPFHKRYKGFRFEACWLHIPEFREVVAQSWDLSVPSANKARVLHIKLARLAKSLKRWNKQRIRASRQESLEAEQLVLRMDQLQEARPLTETELQLHEEAKNKILGMAAMRKIRLRQRSRLTWIFVGDANTKLFHLRVNARGRRNHIPSLQHQGRECITHEAKSAALATYFTEQFGTVPPRNTTLNWGDMQLHRYDLPDLDREVSEEEIHAAIMQTAPEKSPGLDGFIVDFYNVCWDIIKNDIIAAIRDIFELRVGCWNLLNSANVILIKKKERAQAIGDYRPISILHSIAKLLAKILSNRLAL